MVPEDHPFRNKRLNGNNRTPPYVTARPEVTYRKISNDPLSDEGQLRFVVLATDGSEWFGSCRRATFSLTAPLCLQSGTLSHPPKPWHWWLLTHSNRSASQLSNRQSMHSFAINPKNLEHAILVQMHPHPTSCGHWTGSLRMRTLPRT